MKLTRTGHPVTNPTGFALDIRRICHRTDDVKRCLGALPGKSKAEYLDSWFLVIYVENALFSDINDVIVCVVIAYDLL